MSTLSLSWRTGRVCAVLPPRRFVAASRGLASLKKPASLFDPLDTFAERHIGPDDAEVTKMLETIGYKSMSDFISATIPPEIRIAANAINNDNISPFSESQLKERAQTLGDQNQVFKSFIGMGYHCAVIPPVIQRNVRQSSYLLCCLAKLSWLDFRSSRTLHGILSILPINPRYRKVWIAVFVSHCLLTLLGRLESLVNFQTMVASLTAMDIASASMLDEATAAAEGMVMAFVSGHMKRKTFIVDSGVFPQTIAVLKTRAKGFGIRIVVGEVDNLLRLEDKTDVCGVLVQYPDVNGSIPDFSQVAQKVHVVGGLLIAATDLLALTKLKPPGEWGADVVVGNTARFGVPTGYGGPHAAFFAVKDDLKRKMPGRLVGRSRDADGKPAYRLSLQSKQICFAQETEVQSIYLIAREQHIRREKATSNICTSQALLANMAAMYAVYHGPQGLQRIADKVHGFTQVFVNTIADYGFKFTNDSFFDTVTIDVTPVLTNAEDLHMRAREANINLRSIDSEHVGVTFDESITPQDLVSLINVFASGASANSISLADLIEPKRSSVPKGLKRTSPFLPHPVFNKHHSETEILRYINHLASKDLSLTHAMIPLGSCTMKLSSTSSMIPLSWPHYANIHPFAPHDQVQGYHTVIKARSLSLSLNEIDTKSGT